MTPRTKSKRNALPASFETVEDFVKFWDKHDTEDYLDAWREVPFTVTMKTRKYPSVALKKSLKYSTRR